MPARKSLLLRRRNGFEWPLDPLQVAAWVLFVAVNVDLFVLYTPVATPRPLAIALSVFYVIPTVTVLMAAVRCQQSDPGVPVKQDEHAPTPTNAHFCNLCEVYVAPRTRHCYRCGKCISRYDHHCPWLNNCVGEANYGSFIALVSSLLVLTSLHLALIMHAGGLLLVDDSALMAQLAASGLGLSPLAYGIMLALSGLVMAVLWQQLSWLLCLHYLLHLEGCTTAEYFARVERENQPPPRLCVIFCKRWMRLGKMSRRVSPRAL